MIVLPYIKKGQETGWPEQLARRLFQQSDGFWIWNLNKKELVITISTNWYS